MLKSFHTCFVWRLVYQFAFNFQLQASLSVGLGTLHYDSLFDYWKEIHSAKLRNVVKEAYGILQIVKVAIDGENKRRFERGQMTNPYMVPDWIPNSIST